MLPNAKIMHMVNLQSVPEKSNIYSKLFADYLYSHERLHYFCTMVEIYCTFASSCTNEMAKPSADAKDDLIAGWHLAMAVLH